MEWKEMKEMSWYLLGVVTQSLRGESPARRAILNHPIQCIRALLEFYLYAQYKSHDNATWSYMQDALCCVHTFKDGFLLGPAGKEKKVKANTLGTELVKKQQVDEETNVQTWMPFKEHREMNACRDYISHKIDVSKELDTDLYFLKIHLMSHWVEQIRRYGSLQQYSAKRHEQAHNTNLKDHWNAFNHNMNYLPQVITSQRRILRFEIRDLNLQALTRLWEPSPATCKVLPSGADLAAPLNSQSYAKPKFMWRQNRHDGKYADTMIKDFRALLDNTQDSMHRLAIYSGMWEFIMHKSCKKTYISDEHLHAMELCMDHCIKVQVECSDGERIPLICQCTGSQSWRGWDQWNDWVCVKQHPARFYSVLNGHLLWQLQRLCRIKLLTEDSAFVEY